MSAAVAAKGNRTAGGINPYKPPGCIRVDGAVIDGKGYVVAPYKELHEWQDKKIAKMKFNFWENKWNHLSYKSLKDIRGNPYQVVSFNPWVFKSPGGICCQFCGLPMQLASVNRHDSCPYFKKKKEIESKLGITEEQKPDTTVMFRPDCPDGFTYEDPEEAGEDNSDMENSGASSKSDGGLEGGADSKEENISKPGEK